MDRYNKRNYFRVELILPVKWQMLNVDEIEVVKKGQGCNLLTQNLFKHERPEEAAAAKKDDHVSGAFKKLNDKLDFIINTMFCESELNSATDRIVEISASGIKLRTKSDISIGVLLKMRLLFSGSSYLQIEFIAETMRTQKLDNDYLIAANIICIDDDTRDFLIKIIFQKQRFDIRRIKTKNGGPQ
jgi:hypothetical protein